MPPRSKIASLPIGIRAWLDEELRTRGFGDYRDITAALNKRIEQHAAKANIEPDQVGLTTVHRHGVKLQRRIERIVAATEAAQEIQRANPDQADAMSGAVISMIQGDTFEVLLDLQQADEDTDPHKRLKLLTTAARAIADLSHASIRQKQWSSEVHSRLEQAKAEAAEAAETVARRAGLSDDDWGAIRAKILGIEVAA